MNYGTGLYIHTVKIVKSGTGKLKFQKYWSQGPMVVILPLDIN